MPFHASGDLVFTQYKRVEAKIHTSGVTRQAVTQQRREVEAKINQVEAALEALRASNDDRTSHSKKWPAEVSVSGLEVVPLAIHLVSKAALARFVLALTGILVRLE